MNFIKSQATGNDFILVDARNIERDWAKLAQDMCHPHFGIGADGLILVMVSNGASLRMRMLNPDGSEAEICGNGLRCFAKYVIDRQIAPVPSLTVETLAGSRTVQAFLSQGKVHQARVNMGVPRCSAEDIPVVMGEAEKGDSLFREWLDEEPEWGGGWSGWSDCYWLWQSIGLRRDFAKAERILREGLSVPNVSDRDFLMNRLEQLAQERPAIVSKG